MKQDLDNLVAFAPLVSTLVRRTQRANEVSRLVSDLRTSQAITHDAIVSQDTIMLRCNKELSITASFIGAPEWKGMEWDSVKSLVDPQFIVFYEDLVRCLSLNQPRFNGDYPMEIRAGRTEGEKVSGKSVTPYLSSTTTAAYVQYMIYPSVGFRGEAIIVIRKERDRAARIRSAIFPESSAVALIKDPAPLDAGSRDDATILQVNLESFSVTALMFTPLQITHFLTNYYSEVLEVISKFEGTVLSTHSDLVVCVFGLPMGCPDDAERAIQAALEILNTCTVRMRARLDRDGYTSVQVGINTVLTSGLVSGSLCEYKNRATYAVIGDPMRLVGKLATVARDYGARMILDEATHAYAKRVFETREIDIVRPSGAETSAPIFDVIGAAQGMSENDRRTGFICYELGLGEYRQRNFDAALTYFRKCKSLMPADGPAAVMIERCRRAVDDNDLVPQDWNGLWTWGDSIGQ